MAGDPKDQNEDGLPDVPVDDDVPDELEEAARQELEYGADETDEG